jgi:hypothetical protein
MPSAAFLFASQPIEWRRMCFDRPHRVLGYWTRWPSCRGFLYQRFSSLLCSEAVRHGSSPLPDLFVLVEQEYPARDACQSTQRPTFRSSSLPRRLPGPFVGEEKEARALGLFAEQEARPSTYRRGRKAQLLLLLRRRIQASFRCTARAGQAGRGSPSSLESTTRTQI